MRFAECELCYEKIPIEDGNRSKGIHYNWWLCHSCIKEDGLFVIAYDYNDGE
jgi:hypothetical protein